MKSAVRMFAILVTIGVFSACIGVISPDSSPVNLQASTGSEEDKVLLTWTEVRGAGVYVIYRSDSIDGVYSEIGFTDQTAFVDISISPEVHYWYKVSAADLLGRPESELLSSAVKGFSIHTFSWTTSLIDFTGTQVSLAVGSSGSGTAYAAVLDADQSPITVYAYEEDAWVGAGETFGLAEGTTVTGSAAVSVLDGQPYISYRDEGMGGKITASRLVRGPDEDIWETTGLPGQGAGLYHSISSAISGSALYILAASEADSSLSAFRYSTSVGWEDLAPPSVAGSNSILAGTDTAAYIAYEDDVLLTNPIRVREYSSGWSAEALLSPVVSDPGDIPDGYLDFAADTGTGLLVLAYYDVTAAGLRVWKYEGSTWAEISPVVDADPAAASVAVAADQGKVYLLYRDQTTGRGMVQVYTSTWSAIPLSDEQAGITGQFNVSSLRLQARDNVLYAAAIEGSTVNSYIYD
ncbi:MAG: hypothetical protein HN368_07075 [Spirochaetales bacterium]|jgi:hypothetical protein|nr:hypothetical protein [Spirochaetales bacterium]